MTRSTYSSFAEDLISLLWKALIVIVLSFGIVPVSNAAAWKDDSPPIEDPLKGLIDPSTVKPSGVTTIENIEDKRVAVILSDNTETHLKWSASLSEGFKLGAADSFFVNLFNSRRTLDEYDRLLKETYEPKALTEQIIRPLVAKAKRVDIVSDLAAFQEGPYDLAVVVDITFVHIFHVGFIFGEDFQSGANIKALFFDKALRLGPTVTATEKITPHPNVFLQKSAEVRRRVIELYQERMAQVVPVSTSVTTKEGAATPTPKASTAERLKALDELLKQGLISPAEAEAKRKLILADL
jgi:hypothetical protein